MVASTAIGTPRIVVDDIRFPINEPRLRGAEDRWSGLPDREILTRSCCRSEWCSGLPWALLSILFRQPHARWYSRRAVDLLRPRYQCADPEATSRLRHDHG